MTKNRIADRHSPIHSLGQSSIRTHERFSEIGQMASGSGNAMPNRTANAFRANMSIFGGSLHKTFATGYAQFLKYTCIWIFFNHYFPGLSYFRNRNLARMCQLPVINPIRNNVSTSHQFEDPSEPIYTDPSLFERSRCVSLNVCGVELIFHYVAMQMHENHMGISNNIFTYSTW